MNRYTVAVLVKNQFGVLNRVTSMFRRRQFNINSLTVSETESIEYSRITVVFHGDEIKEQQLVNQLYKLPDVCAIRELEDDITVSAELLLIKMQNQADVKDEILATAKLFGATVADSSENSIMLSLTAESRRLDEFINLMRKFTILEICRTGSISLEKGETTIRQYINA